jgi:hypothetical protein
VAARGQPATALVTLDRRRDAISASLSYRRPVQFSEDLRDEVAAGEITVSVRLWQRPKVRLGGRYPVAGTIIEVTSIELLPFSSITDDDVRRSGEPNREALRARAAHAGPIGEDTLVYRIELQVVEPTGRT